MGKRVVEILGVEELIRKLDKMGRVDLRPPMKEASYRVENAAKGFAPVDTGYLKGSIVSKVEGSGANVDGIIGTPVEYAEWQEFGTTNMAGTPFLRTGLASERHNITKIISNYIRRELKG